MYGGGLFFCLLFCLLKRKNRLSGLFLGKNRETGRKKARPKFVVFFWSKNELCPIYIYIYIVELKTGPRFGVSSVKIGPSLVLKTGPRFFALFFPHFYSVFWVFLKTQTVSHCAKIVFLKNLGMSKMRFLKRKLHFLFLSFLCWRIGTEKKDNGKDQKTL